MYSSYGNDGNGSNEEATTLDTMFIKPLLVGSQIVTTTSDAGYDKLTAVMLMSSALGCNSMPMVVTPDHQHLGIANEGLVSVDMPTNHFEHLKLLLEHAGQTVYTFETGADLINLYETKRSGKRDLIGNSTRDIGVVLLARAKTLTQRPILGVAATTIAALRCTSKLVTELDFNKIPLPPNYRSKPGDQKAIELLVVPADGEHFPDDIAQAMSFSSVTVRCGNLRWDTSISEWVEVESELAAIISLRHSVDVTRDSKGEIDSILIDKADFGSNDTRPFQLLSVLIERSLNDEWTSIKDASVPIFGAGIRGKAAASNAGQLRGRLGDIRKDYPHLIVERDNGNHKEYQVVLVSNNP